MSLTVSGATRPIERNSHRMGLYSIVRSLRWSLVGYPANRYAKFLEISEHWSRKEIEGYRNEKLRKLIAHCYENVPYYKRMMEEAKVRPEDIQCGEDLARLPILTKDILRKRSAELMAKNVSEMATAWNRTGGTTGEPIRVCKNRECNIWSSMCYERGIRWGGKPVDEPRVRLFGGTLGVGRTRFNSRLGNIFRRDLFIPAFELRRDNAIFYLDKVRRSACRFAVGYASALYRLATLSREFGKKIEFIAVFPTAELMLPEWEDAIRETFNCSVLPFYGCGEVNSLGFSTPESTGYLIPEEHALIEIMQNDGSTQLYGEGRFLVTDLDNYAMPIIRYVNGDAGEVSVPEGRFPYCRIERLDGRYNSLLMTDSGDLISGVIGTHVFRLTSSVKSYRIIQEEPLKITVKMVPKDGAISQDDELLVVDLFSKYLGKRMTVSLEKVQNLPVPPSGKSIFVVNKVLQ
jgi:phenylacetate-CoA ligase